MSFQAYLDNIQAKTGKSPNDFRVLAEQKGFTENGAVKRDTRADAVVEWLKDDYALGRGHAMAIWALLTGKTS